MSGDASLYSVPEQKMDRKKIGTLPVPTGLILVRMRSKHVTTRKDKKKVIRPCALLPTTTQNSTHG